MDDTKSKGPAVDEAKTKTTDLGAGAEKPKVEQPPVVEETAEETALDRTFAKWMTKHIRNSPISRDTASYNHLMASLPALKSLIEEDTKA